MKFVQESKSTCDCAEDDQEWSEGRVMDLEDDHPVTRYFTADESVLQMVVLIEDGTLLRYSPLERAEPGFYYPYGTDQA